MAIDVIGIIGQKVGMTRIFTEEGESIPVTVIKAEPNRIMQIKTKALHGYDAIQVTKGSRSPSKLNKALLGEYLKVSAEPGEGLWEFRTETLSDSARSALAVGNELMVDIFTVGQKVDVQSVSKGKGFAGTIKRHNFTMGDATHGNSLSHRSPGSIGQRQSPGRVFKNKKMSGHMGSRITSVLSQILVRVDADKNLLFIKGAVPGFPGCRVVVRPAIKVKRKGDNS